MTAVSQRIFLLSPANTSAKRGQLLFNEPSQFDLARRLRREGALLGEIFTFISGLYFRGKLAYAQAFASPPDNVPGVLVMTTSRGLLTPDTVLTLFVNGESDARVPIEEADSRYREPLCRDARALASRVGPDCKIVLLGSIASTKYVAPLLEIFGTQLLFPGEFVGRGDMSRGGLLLRCVQERMELQYASVASAELRGARPPKLPR